jgi:hypothetical protein
VLGDELAELLGLLHDLIGVDGHSLTSSLPAYPRGHASAPAPPRGARRLL